MSVLAILSPSGTSMAEWSDMECKLSYMEAQVCYSSSFNMVEACFHSIMVGV